MKKPRAAMAPGAHDDRLTRKRVTSPTLFRRIAAAFASLALGTGLALVAVAAPASAHHNDIEGVAACNTSGTYDITWKVTNSENLTEEITDSSNTSVVSVGTEIGPNNSATFEQNGVDAGTYHLSLTAKWSNGQTNTSPGTVTAEGDCGDGDNDVKKVTYCHATSSATNPYERITTSVNAFLKSGHIDHDGDIFPAFTYVKNGTTHDIAAQGDQSLLAFEDCAKEIPVGDAPSFSDTCGADNEQLTVPADTTKVDWSSTEANGIITVTATAKAGHVFEPGSKTSWEFAVDDAPCVIDVDGAPSFSDTCGPDNEQLTVPADTDSIEWASVEADGIITVTATAKPGSAFPDGAQVEWVYSIDDEPCPVSTTPTTPTPTPPTDTTPTAATPTGDTLASTGFTGTTISIVAGVILAAGLAFVVIAQVRRKRA